MCERLKSNIVSIVHLNCFPCVVMWNIFILIAVFLLEWNLIVIDFVTVQVVLNICATCHLLSGLVIFIPWAALLHFYIWWLLLMQFKLCAPSQLAPAKSWQSWIIKHLFHNSSIKMSHSRMMSALVSCCKLKAMSHSATQLSALPSQMFCRHDEVLNYSRHEYVSLAFKTHSEICCPSLPLDTHSVHTSTLLL